MADDPRVENLRLRASEVAKLLKTFSHPNRLLIACDLLQGERTVSDLEVRTGVRQPVLSRELARLRSEGLVGARRESKMMFYKLTDERLDTLVLALCGAFGSQTPTEGSRGQSRKTRRPNAANAVKR